MAMQRSYHYATVITVTIIFTIIILYPLLPTLAHSQQQLVYQTANQINNKASFRLIQVLEIITNPPTIK